MYFENLWEAVVSATDNCLSVLSDDEDPDGEISESLKSSLDDLRYKKDRLRLGYLEAD